MKTVMVIFEEIPENCKIFIIQADEKTFEFLKRINDQFINAVETDDDLQDEINELLMDYVKMITPFAPSTCGESCKEVDELQRQINEINHKYSTVGEQHQ